MDSMKLDWDSLKVLGDGFPVGEVLKPVEAEYAPLPDITAYELSKILPFFLGQPLMEAEWNQLGTAQRHLKRKN